MKALYYNAILGILLFFPSFLKAQIRPFEPLNPDRIFFKGKVVDTDNNALPKVSIYIPGSMRGTISDSNGNFYIDAKPKETLYFTYAGKEDAYRQLQEKDTTGFIVQMQPRIQRLKNVHVRKDKKIIEKGEIPTYKNGPNVKKNAFLGLFAGLFASAGIFALLAMMSDFIKTEDDITRYLEIPVLATVPDRKDYIGKNKKNGKKNKKH